METRVKQLHGRRPLNDTRRVAAAMLEGPLPWYCPEHKTAQILHEYDRTVQPVFNGAPALKWNCNHVYMCAACRRPLHAPVSR